MWLNLLVDNRQCGKKNNYEAQKKTLFQGFWVCIFNFAISPHWQSSTRGNSQIWLQVRHELAGKLKNLAIFRWPTHTYYLNMTISKRNPHGNFGALQTFASENVLPYFPPTSSI